MESTQEILSGILNTSDKLESLLKTAEDEYDYQALLEYIDEIVLQYNKNTLKGNLQNTFGQFNSMKQQILLKIKEIRASKLKLAREKMLPKLRP